MITPRLNVEVTQVRNTVCSRNKLMKTSSRRRQILALARQEAAQGRKVLIGTYKPVAQLLKAELAERPTPTSKSPTSARSVGWTAGRVSTASL